MLEVEGWLFFSEGLTPFTLIARSVTTGKQMLGIQGLERPDVAAALGENHPGVRYSGFRLSVPVHTQGDRIQLECIINSERISLGEADIQIVESYPGQIQLPYENTIKHFESLSFMPRRNNMYGSGPPSLECSQEVLNYLESAVKGRTRVLDLGAGTGSYIRALKKINVPKFIGLEIEEALIEQAILLGTDLQLYDGTKIPYEDNFFDATYSIEVMEHVEEPVLFLQEIFRVTKKTIIISVPNIVSIPYLSQFGITPYHMLEGSHLTFYTPKILENIIRMIEKNSNKVLTKLNIFQYGLLPISRFLGQKVYNHILLHVEIG